MNTGMDDGRLGQNNLNTPDGAKRQMVEVALRRLDSTSEVLTMLYVDNDAAPKEIREVFSKLVGGEISQDEARKALEALVEDASVEVPTARDMGFSVMPSFGLQQQDQRLQRLQLQEEVRSALMTRRAGEVAQAYLDPEMKEKVKEVTETTMRAMITVALGDNLEPEEVEEVESQIKVSIEIVFSDPKQRMTMAAQQAAREFQTQEEYEREFEESVINKMQEAGHALTPEILEEFRAVNALLVPIRGPQQEIIEKLTDRAENVGVDAATTKDSIAQVTKEVFPSAADYQEHSYDAIRKGQEFIDKLAEVFAKAGEIGEMVGKLMVTVTRTSYELTGELLERELPKKIDALYGDSQDS